MKFKLVCILTLLLLSRSCKKQPSVIQDSIKAGKVIDGNTGKPLPGTWVYLLKKSKDASSVWGMQTINSRQTNKDGDFNFDYERENNYTYYLVAESEPYYGRTDFIFVKQGDQSPVIKMFGAGWIRFRLINEPPLDTLAYIYISVFGQINSLFKDTTIYTHPLKGNSNIHFIWNRRIYPYKEITDSGYVTTIPLDTITYTIKY
jgi:hypothetical protein